MSWERYPQQSQGIRSLMTVSHSAEEKRCQKVTCSTRQRVIHQSKRNITILPLQPFLRPLLSLARTLDSSSPHLPFPAIEPLVDLPTHSVSDKDAER